MKTTAMNIVTENRLIAEFMGFIFYDDENRWYNIEEGYFLQENIKYNSSWDWLIPVISKITTQEKYIGLMHRENIMDTVPYGLIDDTYNYVVEFIKWYNKN